jgi:leader peptidase (prepilin peptidase)/N-methyltransferase
MTILIFFLFGLIIGSFLNVVVYRLELAESLMGRSHCPHCQKQIRWYDNVPLLSFILLGAKCRDCEGKISWQYPVMEFFTGVVFALVGYAFFQPLSFQSWGETAFYLAIFSVMLVIFLYDFKFMEIPMLVLWIGVAITMGYYLVFDWQNFVPELGLMNLRLFSGILAGGGVFLVFFLLSALSKEKWMGMGDAYLALLIGLTARFPLILFALLLAFTIGAIFGIILIALKKKTLQSQVPFGPFMVLGCFLAILLPLMFPAVKFWLILFF